MSPTVAVLATGGTFGSTTEVYAAADGATLEDYGAILANDLRPKKARLKPCTLGRTGDPEKFGMGR